jgi:5-oxoprolinase (ATP-hydrolysing)
MSIAEQMGLRLQNTAYSVNIKERLDFSCALFDASGSLIANAPHMPVHLGSMGESIKTVMRLNAGRIRPGNVYVLNAPYNGGTHLPDVTVITPVFDELNQNILFYVGSRGHHADIGGITPGSMPPGSKRVEEEGVLIDNFLLVEDGRWREVREAAALLGSGAPGAQHPAEHRRPARAGRRQRKACRSSAAWSSTSAWRWCRRYMRRQDNAENRCGASWGSQGRRFRISVG